MKAKCKTCQYFVVDDGPKSPDGTCYRYPPVGISRPSVALLDWCGEWKLKEKDTDEKV